MDNASFRRWGWTIALVILCSGMAICYNVEAGTTQPGADFKISDLVLPVSPTTGEKITISATIANTATFDGNYEATLIINGVEEGRKVVNVPPKAEREITFELTLTNPGLCEVDLDGLKGSFTVVQAVSSGDAGFPVAPVVGALAGVVLVGALIIIWFSRKKRAGTQA